MAKQLITIEALLVWAYREQKADHWWTSHQGLMPGELAVQSGRPQLRLSVGGTLAHEADDTSSFARMLVPWQIDGDAKAVHELVLGLPMAQQTAVVMSARRGRRPELLARPPRFVPTGDLAPATRAEAEHWQSYMQGPRRGRSWYSTAALAALRRFEVRPGTLLAPTVNHPRSRRPALTELRIDPDPRDWLAAATLYETWRAALATLAWFLRQSDRLEHHALLPDLPPSAPPPPSFVTYFVARATDAHPEGNPLAARPRVPSDPDWELVGMRRRAKPKSSAAQKAA
jgi:hypothetical protein